LYVFCGPTIAFFAFRTYYNRLFGTENRRFGVSFFAGQAWQGIFAMTLKSCDLAVKVKQF
jgi:hypothetical protein